MGHQFEVEIGFALKQRNELTGKKKNGGVSQGRLHRSFTLLVLFSVPSSPSFSLWLRVRGNKRAAELEEETAEEEESGWEAGKPFYNWVTWKCQRWGASFCETHTNTSAHTQSYEFIRCRAVFSQTHTSSPSAALLSGWDSPAGGSSSLWLKDFSLFLGLWSTRSQIKGRERRKVVLHQARKKLERPHMVNRGYCRTALLYHVGAVDWNERARWLA